MQPSQLVELAALIANHGPAFIHTNAPLSITSLEQYWSASKCRLDRWSRSLKTQADHLQSASPANRQYHWDTLRPILEEILTGEVLTRVWTAVLTARDKRLKVEEAEPIARSVYIGHLEARNRVLRLLVYGQGVDLPEAVILNRLRSRTERWTDMLLGNLLPFYDATEWAFDEDRCREFAQDMQHSRSQKQAKNAWQLSLASLRAAFSQRHDTLNPNSDLNLRIASGILTCFGEDLFDSTGLVKSLWQVRLSNTTSDAQILIEDFLRTEDFSTSRNPQKLRSQNNRIPRF